jgi:hypothetical protein
MMAFIYFLNYRTPKSLRDTNFTTSILRIIEDKIKLVCRPIPDYPNKTKFP